MKPSHACFKIKTSIIIIVLLFIIAGVLFYLYFKENDEKLLAVFGSLAAGLIVAIIQLIIALQENIQIEKLKNLELINIMYSRDERAFYRKYIDTAKENIYVMGVTAIRFFKDFADIEPSAPQDAKVLLGKLGKNIKVKILLPSVDYLRDNKKNDFNSVKQYKDAIMKELPNCRLEIKYFNHIPSHSIFIVDKTCIVGPVFPKIESKYTPALHLKNTSPIAQKYLDYFNDEWENANE